MLFLIHLFSIVQSAAYFDQPGYHIAQVNPKDIVTVNLQSGLYDCVFIWSHNINNDVIINASNAAKTNIFDLHGKTSAVVQGYNATIQVSIHTQILIWIIKPNLCSPYSLLYTTSHFITDSFQTKKEVENLCIFFGNHNNKSRLSFSLDKPHTSPSISIYSENSIDNPYLQADHLKSHEFTNHFFIHVKNSEQYHLKFEIRGNEAQDMSCDHFPISMISIDKNEENDILEESIISCIVEENENANIILYLILLMFFILTIIGVSLCYITEFYKKIAQWINGIINDGPVKFDIDTNEILQIDEIDDISGEETQNNQHKDDIE